MESAFVDVRRFTEHYRSTFARTLEVCRTVPESKWNWRPAETMRSFRELVGDIVGNQLVTIRGILHGEWDLERSRVDFSSPAEALDFLRRLHEDAVSELSVVSNAFFHREVPSPFGDSVSRDRLAVRMLEKEMSERGGLYLYLRLAGVDIPPPGARL